MNCIHCTENHTQFGSTEIPDWIAILKTARLENQVNAGTGRTISKAHTQYLARTHTPNLHCQLPITPIRLMKTMKSSPLGT